MVSGGSNAIDLTGWRFGRLFVVERAGVIKNGRRVNVIWQCQCDCERLVQMTTQDLRQGNATSCRRGECHPRGRPRGMAMAWVAYKRYRHNARSRGLEFAIAFEQFVRETQRNCAYCGAAPQLEMLRAHSNGAYIYNGLDRVDNWLGYQLNNLVACCKLCNKRKGKLPVEVFVRRWCVR